MPRRQSEKPNILRDLGNGLILRRARQEDTDALATFLFKVFNAPEIQDEESSYVANWTRNLMSGAHPTFSPQDFLIAEDTRTGKIVSSMCLISQTWSYGGIKFGVGRPEVVATHPDYRRRGLVRQQFEILHQWSARRKEKVQAITGIPYFYRQFDYEMALEMNSEVKGPKSQVPKLKPGEKELYRLRLATPEDLSFISRVYRAAGENHLVTCERNLAMWRYQFHSSKLHKADCYQWRIIESAKGEPVGYLIDAGKLWDTTIGAIQYELKPGSDWLAVTPSVLRHLIISGEALAKKEKKTCEAFSFWVSSGHPLNRILPTCMKASFSPNYAFYLRVPDLPDFLQHIKPVLERRLADSIAAGHSGELKLSFYRQGLALQLKAGRIRKIEPWQPESETPIAFPGLTFLQLLFGYRTLEELNHAYPDCFVRDEVAGILLNILFPKQPSCVWPVG